MRRVHYLESSESFCSVWAYNSVRGEVSEVIISKSTVETPSWSSLSSLLHWKVVMIISPGAFVVIEYIYFSLRASPKKQFFMEM